ncbi:MAG: HicB like antitoxin of bacterial toxin-antitoxin system [Dehalococcoidia bacterium]|nr:HicB like antitoxin of bacterial toxin-antitoxin system [Dehalococcoidia bacterium]
MVEVAQQEVHAVIFKDAESDQWLAMCLEYDVVTQGDSEEHAKAMIQEAVELYLEDIPEHEREALYQAIEGEPRLHRLPVNAPSLLYP